MTCVRALCTAVTLVCNNTMHTWLLHQSIWRLPPSLRRNASLVDGKKRPQQITRLAWQQKCCQSWQPGVTHRWDINVVMDISEGHGEWGEGQHHSLLHGALPEA